MSAAASPRLVERTAGTLVVANASARPLGEVPWRDPGAFQQHVVDATRRGHRVAALVGYPRDRGLAVLAVLADDDAGTLELLRTELEGPELPALTPRCPQVHLFERELAEQWGVVPVGHPWLKPVRFQPPRHAQAGARPAIGLTSFYAIQGGEVHEVAVGPVHAGVIEPGHFRFQCYGENVIHLELSLGYQHRGVERALVGGPTPRSVHYAETLAGDTTIGHATAYCQVVEALAGAAAPARSLALRAIAAELERLANHVGDLGALAGDVGFLPTASFCGRLRGDYLNLTAELCGSRFGRGLLRPGGTRFDVAASDVPGLVTRIDRALRETEEAVELLWSTASVQSRFEDTGRLDRAVAEQLGVVGVVARASGLHRDVRTTHPYGYYRFAQLPMSVMPSGDVFARAFVRYLEVRRSAAFVRRELELLPRGATRVPVGALRPEHVAVSLVEGWRGELCHVAMTDAAGRFATYKIVDPSFHNWTALAMALRGQQISDFPLCNKSFNLSYCGHDL
jgi:Ni,Fe-hydrogenase III large subunit